ncbi:hypothetical protein Daesc_003281 [Daldinia eschscholtzii]|uniref:Uncharacterized protein n=1 Tax=Daldinia eschscholtzii TaxID=292717 RepID=A0AAX6MSN7_9PEZI
MPIFAPKESPVSGEPLASAPTPPMLSLLDGREKVDEEVGASVRDAMKSALCHLGSGQQVALVSVTVAMASRVPHADHQPEGQIPGE